MPKIPAKNEISAVSKLCGRLLLTFKGSKLLTFKGSKLLTFKASKLLTFKGFVFPKLSLDAAPPLLSSS